MYFNVDHKGLTSEAFPCATIRRSTNSRNDGNCLKNLEAGIIVTVFPRIMVRAIIKFRQIFCHYLSRVHYYLGCTIIIIIIIIIIISII